MRYQHQKAACKDGAMTNRPETPPNDPQWNEGDDRSSIKTERARIEQMTNRPDTTPSDPHRNEGNNNELPVLSPIEQKDTITALQLLASTGCTLAQVASFYIAERPQALTPMSFAEASQRVIQRAQNQGRRTTTIRNMQSAYRKLTPLFGAENVQLLTGDKVEDLLSHLQTNGRASSATINTMLSLIKAAMRAAGIRSPLPQVLPQKVFRNPTFLGRNRSAQNMTAMFSRASNAVLHPHCDLKAVLQNRYHGTK